MDGNREKWAIGEKERGLVMLLNGDKESNVRWEATGQILSRLTMVMMHSIGGLHSCADVYAWVGGQFSSCSFVWSAVNCVVHLLWVLCPFIQKKKKDHVFLSIIVCFHVKSLLNSSVLLDMSWLRVLRLLSSARRLNPGENHMWVKVAVILMHPDECSVSRIVH